MIYGTLLVFFLRILSSVLGQELGTRWEYLHGLSAKQCDVVNDNTLWCVDRKGNIHKHVIGAATSEGVRGKLRTISAGLSGVWGINKIDKIFYRAGTHGNASHTGTKWVRVRGFLRSIAVGENVVVATKSDKRVYVRIGITDDNPTGKQWKRIKGRCRSVDISGTNDFWCVNKQYRLFKYNWSVDNWVRVKGRVKKIGQISTGPAGVWGISKKKILYRDGSRGQPDIEGNKWMVVKGGPDLRYISCGSSVIVGTTKKGRIWIKFGLSDENELGVGEWRTISPIHQKQCSIAAADKTFWCVGRKKRIYNYELASRSWAQVKGSLSKISAGHSGVWGIKGQKIYHRLDTYGNSQELGSRWKRVAGRLSRVDVGRNVVVGTNKKKQIYIREGITAENHLGTSWTRLRGKAKQCGVFASSATIWCVKRNGRVIRYLPDTKKWERVDGRFKSISVGSAGIWTIDSGLDVFHRYGTYNNTNLSGTSWGHVPRKFKKLSVGIANLVAIDKSKDVYLRLGIAHAEDESVLQYVDLDFEHKRK